MIDRARRENERSREVLTCRGGTVGPANSSSLGVSKILSNKVQGDSGRLTLRRAGEQGKRQLRCYLGSQGGDGQNGKASQEYDNIGMEHLCQRN